MVTVASLAGIYIKPRVPGEFGLPKTAISEAEILPDGLRGDFNSYRQAELHGDTDSAVLLMTDDVVETLRREGWPLRPGDLGENLLLRGVAYDALRPPQRLRVGGSVALTTTRACDPCRRLVTLPYVGEGRGVEFVRTMLNRRGWYARVVEPGSVRVGDRVELA